MIRFLILAISLMLLCGIFSCGDDDDSGDMGGSDEFENECRNNCEEEHRCLEIADDGWIDTCTDSCVMMLEYGSDSDRECIQCYLDCRKDYEGDCDAQEDCILNVCGRMQDGGPCP